jgi:hypothetical protein
MKAKILEKTIAPPPLNSILVEEICLTMTRFVILIFAVVAFFSSGESIQAQYSALPRQCTDAYLECQYFIGGQITIGKAYVPSTPEKLWFAQFLAAQRLTPAQMQMMWNMPVFWARFQMTWSNLSEWQKEALRQSWRLQIAAGAAYGTQQSFASGPSNVSPSYTRMSEGEAIGELEHKRAISSQLQNFSTSMCNSTIELMHAMSR